MDIWAVAITLFLTVVAARGCCAASDIVVSSTIDEPFVPVTVRLGDEDFRGNAVDLPETDPRVMRQAKGFEPEQISVSLSATADSVWISWVSGNFQIGGDIQPLDPATVASIVRYGRLYHHLSLEAVGYSLIYNQLYPFDGLQNYTSGIIHHVLLTVRLFNCQGQRSIGIKWFLVVCTAGLKPGTRYFYRCGDPTIPAMSTIHEFRTMPLSGPKSYPERIAVVGDLGLTYNTTSTVDHMKNNKPDLILLVGDVTYANLYLTNGTGSDCYSCSFPNTPIHETYQPRWDYWARFMEPTVSKIPIMVVEGNHEQEKQVDSKTFEAYSSRFAFPAKESGSDSTFYYSFKAGGIHFVVLGAYISYNNSGEQYKWLQRDLAAVDKSVTPWLIATWHPPWYSTYHAHYREAECMRVEMEELLYSYGVDIVFSGHVHAYERSNRVYNYTLNPCAPIHITVGDGGNREKMAIAHADDPGQCPDPTTTPDDVGGFCAFNFTSGPAEGKFCWDRQPNYSAYRESSFGHGILEVEDRSYTISFSPTWHCPSSHPDLPIPSPMASTNADSKISDTANHVTTPSR